MSSASNVYILVDGRNLDLCWGSVAKEVSTSTKTGGSDGLIVLQNPTNHEVADIKMLVYNPDGSQAEISGNGARLTTKFVADERLVLSSGDSPIRIETLAGIKRAYKNLDKNGKVCLVKVEIGTPKFDLESVGINKRLVSDKKELINHPLRVGQDAIGITCLSVGNPHAVHVVSKNENLDTFALTEIGARVEHDPLFLNRTNFEVVQVLDRNCIKARIFERGVGETMSSGTCSTAAAVACRRLGLVDDKVAVRVAGGVMEVSFEKESVYSLSETTKITDGVFSTI